MVLYFSGTGNSRRVAECVAGMLDDRVYSMLEAAEESMFRLADEEKLGFVFPVYSWGPPAVVVRALRKLRTSCMPEYVYFICTCGDDTGKTADIFRKEVATKGWKCQAGFSVMMPNTYVCLPGFDVDSVRLANLKLNGMKGRLEFIVSCIKSRKQVTDCHEGIFPRLKSYFIRPFFLRYLTSPEAFCVSETCISCGKCVQVCPLHNIRLVEGHPVWGSDCAMCLACYHHCPSHAVGYGNMTKGKGQFTLEKKE